MVQPNCPAVEKISHGKAQLKRDIVSAKAASFDGSREFTAVSLSVNINSHLKKADRGFPPVDGDFFVLSTFCAGVSADRLTDLQGKAKDQGPLEVARPPTPQAGQP